MTFKRHFFSLPSQPHDHDQPSQLCMAIQAARCTVLGSASLSLPAQMSSPSFHFYTASSPPQCHFQLSCLFSLLLLLNVMNGVCVCLCVYVFVHVGGSQRTFAFPYGVTEAQSCAVTCVSQSSNTPHFYLQRAWQIRYANMVNASLDQRMSLKMKVR